MLHVRRIILKLLRLIYGVRNDGGGRVSIDFVFVVVFSF